MSTTPYAVAAALLECCRAGLGDDTPARACVVPGNDIPFDDCCEGGGQLYIGVQTVTPVEQFPIAGGGLFSSTGSGTANTCNSCRSLPYLAVPIDIVIARCAPSLDDDGNPPACTALDAAAARQSADAMAVLTAVNCCLDELGSVDAIECWLAGDQNYLVGGGCAGSSYSVQVALCNPGCPPGS